MGEWVFLGGPERLYGGGREHLWRSKTQVPVIQNAEFSQTGHQTLGEGRDARERWHHTDTT